jgi:osmoprotectant transport system ATP-binding protein
MPVLSLTQVGKTYGGGKSVVNAVSFDADAGELVVILGESGSGKTTMLKMINRLITPTSGTIAVNGQDTGCQDPVTLRRSIGYVFQGVGLFPHMTIAQNIGITPSLLGWAPNRIAARVDQMLELVRLPPADYRARLPSELSGGQRQRVGFARALAAEPAILLLDEPFGALDPITRHQVRQDFQTLQKELNLTAVMVTHDVTEALLLADRVLVMRNGQILQDATPSDLVTHPADGYVAQLVETPRAQARFLEGLAP